VVSRLPFRPQSRKIFSALLSYWSSTMQSLIKPDWPAPGNVRAAVTTRIGGVSQAPFASNNLALHVGDEPSAVEQNRHILVETLALKQQPLWLEQTHSADVISASDARSDNRADGCVSQQAGEVCAVLTADCLPILLCDASGQSVAAVHAGWRGLYDGIVANAVHKMDKHPAEIMAWFGPAISQAAYQVDQEFYQRFIKKHPLSAAAFLPSEQAGHYQACLKSIASMQLRYCGVRQIYSEDYCTYQQDQQFYSYRREAQTGRIASLIWRTH